jgi:drug/metabolite transporter (DMT)-like permease
VNKGILYIVISGLSFLVVNFFVKIMGAGPQQELFPGIQQYPGHELVLARSIISFSLSFYVIKKRRLPLFGNNKKWLLIRGTSGMIALTMFFYTLHHLPLAIASTVQYLAPVFTVIFALLLLGEKVRWVQWYLIGISFVGVFLIGMTNFISGEPSQQIDYSWLLLGIISAAFSGIAYTAIRKLKGTDTPINIVIYFPMISIPVMAIWSCFEFTMPRGIEWLFLLVIGIFTQIAQVMLTKALHEGSASLITPFQYLGAIYAALIGLFIFDERLSWVVYTGIACVLAGVILNAVSERQLKYREKSDAA